MSQQPRRETLKISTLLSVKAAANKFRKSIAPKAQQSTSMPAAQQHPTRRASVQQGLSTLQELRVINLKTPVNDDRSSSNSDGSDGHISRLESNTSKRTAYYELTTSTVNQQPSTESSGSGSIDESDGSDGSGSSFSSFNVTDRSESFQSLQSEEYDTVDDVVGEKQDEEKEELVAIDVDELSEAETQLSRGQLSRYHQDSSDQNSLSF
jgi:hypothetical protein